MSKPPRILVVDDEPTALRALAELFRWDGYCVETAANGLQGLAKFREFAPDIVLSDLQMPSLDGIGLMRKIHEQAPRCPVLIMTTYAETESGSAAVAAGAVRCLA